MDGWNLFLEALKRENFVIYAILKSFTPARIEDGKLFIYTDKEFMKLIAEDKLNEVEPILKHITGLVPQITDENGNRIEVPVIERESKKVDITAKLRKVIFKKGDYCVLAFDTENASFTAVGSTVVPLIEGAQYKVVGEWITHQKYGKQVAFHFLDPIAENDMVKFLSSGIITGIKQVVAKHIVEAFGDKTLDVLDNDIDRLLEVKGIGRKTLAKIKASYRKNKALKDTALFFSKYGIPLSQIYKLFKAYGEDTVKVVSENPYRLIEEIDGIGFKKADKIAKQIGIEESDPYRIQAGIYFTLKQSLALGNVYLPADKLLSESAKTLGTAKELISPVLNQMENIVNDDENIYLKEEFDYEKGTAEHLLRIWKSARPMKYRFISNTPLSDEQKKAVRNVFSKGISIITGAPGTGKTTVIKAIVESGKASGYSIALASPTGKAAVRMEEVSEHSAKTIHRLIGLPDSFHKISHDIVVIDESSMLDINLAFYLLSAVKKGAHIVFVGDADQLPSVGPGNFLSDIISLFPTMYLTHIYRQGEGSGIAVNALRINKGQWIVPYKDFVFVNREDEQDILDFVVNFVSRNRQVQVLSPMRRGTLGVTNLNRTLQAVLNPYAPSEITFFLRTFKAGDRIMQLSNDYEKEVFNGETGKVIYADEDGLEADFSGRTVYYNRGELTEIDLAYASTVHKFQGSETPKVLIVLHTSHSIMLQRRLLYTAVTRAKKRTVIVGSKKALETAIKNNRTIYRYSGLKKCIVQEKKEAESKVAKT